MDLKKFDQYLTEKVDDKSMDRKMLKKGKYLKIILPKGMGEPLYTNDFNAAKEMAKEYGKGTKVVNLKENVNEESLEMERMKLKKIQKVSDMAQDAFWKVVKDEFKEYKTEEINSYDINDFDRIATQMVKNFYNMNRNINRNMEKSPVGY